MTPAACAAIGPMALLQAGSMRPVSHHPSVLLASSPKEGGAKQRERFVRRKTLDLPSVPCGL